MQGWRKWAARAVLAACFVLGAGAHGAGLTILTYHRFGPDVADSMTVRTATFAAQMKWLNQHGYTILPLSQALQARKAGQLPDKAVAITVDDGHASVASELLPLVLRERIPVTLFIYPSAISNAAYALTWPQLEQLLASGLFEIGSHTYWHPDFRHEKQRLPALAYQRFVRMQLESSRQILQKKLEVNIDLLAWPFGIYDAELMQAARAAGYAAAFSIDGRAVRADDDDFALPRILVQDALGVRGLERLLEAR